MKLVLKTGKMIIPLILLVLFAGVFLLLFFNSDQVADKAREKLVSALEEQLGDDIKIGSVTMFPLNRITLHQVEIANGDKPLFRAERIVVSFYLTDLLQGVDKLIEGIREVKLVKPQVYLVKNETGFGFEKYFEKTGDQGASLNLSPEIRVIDGQLKYKDERIEEAIGQVNGNVHFDDLGITFDVTGEVTGLDQMPLAVRGSLAPQLELAVEFSSLPLKKVFAYGRAFEIAIPEIESLDGNLSGNLQIQQESDGSLSAYSGDFQLLDVQLGLKSYPLQINGLEGRISVKEDLLFIQQLEGELPMGSFQLQGQVDNFSDPSLTLAVTTPDLNLEELTPYIPQLENLLVTGELKGDLEVIGRWQNPVIKGDFIAPEITYKDVTLKNLLIDWRYQDLLLTLKELEFQLGDGKFAASSGYIDLKDINKPAFSMNVNLERLKLEESLSFLELPQIPEGEVTGEVYLSGKGLDPKQLNALGSLQIERGQYLQFPFERLETHFWVTTGELGLSKVDFKSPYLTTVFSGKLDLDGQISLTLEPSTVDLSWFGKQFAFPADGQGVVQGEILGSFDQPEFVGEVALESGQLWNQKFDQLAGEARIDLQEINLVRASVTRDESNLELSGKVGFVQENLDLRLQIQHSSLTALKEILDFMDIPFDITGDITGDIYLQGSWLEPKVQGDLITTNGVILQQPYNKAELSFNWENRDILFEKFMISYQNTVLEASGKLEDYQELDIEMVGQGFDLTDIEQVSQQLPQITGRANFRGKLTGPLTSPSFWGTISTDSLSYNQLPIEQVSALLQYEEGVLKIKPMKVINEGSEYTLMGEIYFNERIMDIKIDNKDSYLSDILRYIDLPISVEGLDYTLGGTIWIRGDLQRPIFELAAELRDQQAGTLSVSGIYDLDQGMNFQLNGTNFSISAFQSYIGTKDLNYTLDGTASLVGQFQEPNADLDVVFRDVTGGELELVGTYTLQEGFDLRLEANRLDLQPLQELIPMKQDYSGKVTASGTLQGQPDQLNAHLELEIEKPVFNNYKIAKLGGTVELNSSYSISLDQHLMLPDGNSVQVSGTMPITNRNGPINLRLIMQEGNLAILPLFIPGMERAGGEGQADLTLKGTFNRPRLKGEVVISDGFTKYTGIDLIKNITGAIRIENGRGVIEQLQGDYGPGKVQVDGEIILDGFLPDRLNLQVTGDNFHFAYGSIDVLAEADISVQGAFLKPEIRGSALVHDGEVGVLPFFWPVAEGTGVFQPIFYLELTPGENLRVTGESPINMNTTLIKNDENQLIVDTTSGEVILTGELTARSGTFNIYSSNFRITRAAASFLEFNKFLPVLSIYAETEVGGYRIFLDLSGLPTVDEKNLEMRLTSEPRLSEAQIYALLAGQGGLGEFLEGSGDVTEMISDEIWRYINQGLRNEFLNKLEESVEKALRLDTFYIDPVLFGDTKINLQVGKYLDENFYVVYKRTFSQNPDQSIGFEYQLTPTINLEGIYKSVGDYQFSLNADLSF